MPRGFGALIEEPISGDISTQFRHYDMLCARISKTFCAMISLRRNDGQRRLYSSLPYLRRHMPLPPRLASRSSHDYHFRVFA